jgi:hypothetical protein
MVSYLGEGRRGEGSVGRETAAAQLVGPNFQDAGYVLQTERNPVFLEKSPQKPKEDHDRGDLQVQFLMTAKATRESDSSWDRC